MAMGNLHQEYCTCQCHQPKEEVADWAEEFDKLLEPYNIIRRNDGHYKDSILLELKSFITKTLADQKAKDREELIKEIERMVCNGCFNPSERHATENEILRDIINKLKNNE